MVLQRVHSNKPRTCLRNARRMCLTPCLVFLTSGILQEIKSKGLLLCSSCWGRRNSTAPWHLNLKCQQQKSYNDQNVKTLASLHPQQVLWLQTDKGYQKVGVVQQPAAQPWSYIVEAEGKEYCRNQRGFLSVSEPAPAKLTFPAVTKYNISPVSPPMLCHQFSNHHLNSLLWWAHQTDAKAHLRFIRRLPQRSQQNPEGYVARYGRMIKPNPKFWDWYSL